MRYGLIIFLILLISMRLYSQDIPGKTFGGDKNDVGYTLCKTNDGGFLLAGTTRSYGAGSEDIYIVRIDENGTVVWIKTYGWLHRDNIRSAIAVDDGFILGGDVWDYGMARLDLYLMKIDNQGNLIWNQFYGTHYRESGFRVIPADNNGYYLLGYSRGFEPRGDLFLIKTDHQGNEIWRNTYGSEYDDYGFDIITDKDDVLMIGSRGGFYDDVHANFKNHDADIYLIKADKDGTEQWQKTFGGNGHDFGQSIKHAGNDGYFLFGSTQSRGAGSFDMTLIRINSQYEELWQKTYGGPEYEYGMSMDKNQQEELFLLGTTKSFGLNDSEDFYLIKTDSAGETMWSLIMGGKGRELGHQVIATADSGCIVIGQSNSFGNGSFDFLLTKVNKYGKIEYFIEGIDSTTDEKLLVYPNPVRGIGKIKISSNIPITNYRMEMISLNGSFTRSFIIHPPDYNFSVQTLKPGFYVYHIISEATSEVMYTGKLIIY